MPISAVDRCVQIYGRCWWSARPPANRGWRSYLLGGRIIRLTSTARIDYYRRINQHDALLDQRAEESDWTWLAAQ